MATRSSPSSRIPSSRRPAISIDEQRYHLFRSGISVEELAARENVRLITIQSSIERMEAKRSQFSLESVNQNYRERLNSSLETAFAALESALLAEITVEAEEEVLIGETSATDDSSAAVTAKTSVTRPDYQLRLAAFREFRQAWTSLQPKSPLLAVDARTQIQNNNQPALPAGQTLSTESIIRQIRAERGLALTSGSGDTIPMIMPRSEAEPVPVEVDTELQQELAETSLDDGDILDAE